MNEQEPRLLVTTALEETWGSDEPLVYLGEWCRLYDRREVWSGREYASVRNHWDDRTKLRQDYDYLQGLHESILNDLGQALNRIHGVERPLRYWRMIVDPWLLTYIAVVFDRWECLRVAFEDYVRFETKELQQLPEPEPPCDYSDFIAQIAGDLWNYRLFLDIIRYKYPDKCLIRDARELLSFSGRIPESPGLKPRARSLAETVGRYLDGVMCSMSSGNPVLFMMSYFPLSSLLRLNLALRQVPCFYLKEFEWSLKNDSPSDALSRKQIAFDRPADNAFEDYLMRRLAMDIPRAYIEDFPAMLKRVNRMPFKPKAIFSANAHWNNELFKIYSAEQVHNRGVKFVTMTHGGAIPAQFDLMHFEEDIADIKTTWAVPHHPKHVQLPPNKLSRWKIQSSKEYCAVLGIEVPRYSYRAGLFPISSQVLAHYNQVCDLYHSLNDAPQRSFRVRPYFDLGWNTKQRYIDTLGVEKVSTEQSYLQFLSSARVIVCTYPQTTFSEAMASGLPAILLYPAHLWETIPELDPLLETLKSAGIVFVDPKAAAGHVNEIWADPERWWNSPNVVNARQEFHRQACRNDPDWLKQWVTFVQDVIAE